VIWEKLDEKKDKKDEEKEKGKTFFDLLLEYVTAKKKKTGEVI